MNLGRNLDIDKKNLKILIEQSRDAIAKKTMKI